MKIKCQASNRTVLSFCATDLGQGIKLSWRVIQHSFIVALVILGVLPTFTGVGSISPDHRKTVGSNFATKETVGSQFKPIFPKNHQTSGILGIATTANNYSLALLSEEWNGRKATSNLENTQPWNYSDAYIDTNKDYSASQLITNENVSLDKRNKQHNKELKENNIGREKDLHMVKDNTLNLNEVNNRLLQYSAKFKYASDSNDFSISNDKGRIDQIISCPNCVGANSLSYPSPAVSSLSTLTGLNLPRVSARTRLRRSIGSHERSSDNKHHNLKFHDRKRKHFTSKNHHLTKKRRYGFSSPHVRHHGSGSAWWWNLIRLNRPGSVDLISESPLPEAVAQSTDKETGNHSRQQNYTFSQCRAEARPDTTWEPLGALTKTSNRPWCIYFQSRWCR